MSSLRVLPTAVDGLFVLSLREGRDGRGVVREQFRQSAYDALLPRGTRWRQINVTETRAGAVRGLHGEDMSKLVGVVHGAAHGAYVDARAGSPTRGRAVEVELRPGTQVFVPRGVLNGFQALAGGCVYLYCFDAEWEPDMPGVSVDPLDPSLPFSWPLPVDRDDRELVSAKDASAAPLAALLSPPMVTR